MVRKLKIMANVKKIFSKFISSKVDVRKIVSEHYNTLYNYRKGDKKKDKKDIFTFFGIPFIISVILVFLSKGSLESSITDSILISLSIFTPILFSLLVAIYSINRERLKKKKVYKVIKEFKANVSFTIIISLITIFFTVIYSMNIWGDYYYLSVLSFIIIFLVGIIGLTLLQILKRWNYLLDETLREIEPEKEKIL